MKDQVLFVDLQDATTKKLGQTITSTTSKRLLELLSQKKWTASALSKELSMPLPTVHYHLQRLQDARLVVAKEFSYSKKGREINHYELASKFIVIAPYGHEGIKEKLRGLLPVGLVFAGISFLIRFLETRIPYAPVTTAAQATSEVVKKGVETAVPFAAEQSVPVLTQEPSLALWFFLGSMGVLVALAFYMIVKSGLQARKQFNEEFK